MKLAESPSLEQPAVIKEPKQPSVVEGPQETSVSEVSVKLDGSKRPEEPAASKGPVKPTPSEDPEQPAVSKFLLQPSIHKDSEQLAVKKGPEKLAANKEEETEDILDLGVTDALDDLVSEEENVHSRNISNKHRKIEIKSTEQKENTPKCQQSKEFTPERSQEYHPKGEPEVPTVRLQIDLREKLREKSNSQRECFERNSRSEDDEAEEAKGRRSQRFQSERVSIPPKMNHEIPDSLENVLTSDQHKLHYRSRDRGDRSDRGDRDRCDRGDRGDRGDRDRGDRDDRGNRGDRRNIRGRTEARYDVHPSGR